MRNACGALLIMMVTATAVLAAESEEKGVSRLPVREIDRPLLMPKGVWQVSPDCGGVSVAKDFSGTYRGYVSAPSPVTWLVSSVAVTDRVALSMLPFPYVKVLMTSSDIGRRPDGAVCRFAMAYEGGLSGLSIREVTNVSLDARLGLSTKLLLTGNLWHQQHFSFSWYSRFQSMVINEILGLQVTDRIWTACILSGGMRWVTGMIPHTRFFGNVGLQAMSNLNGRISLGAAAYGGVYQEAHGGRRSLSAGAGPRLKVQW